MKTRLAAREVGISSHRLALFSALTQVPLRSYAEARGFPFTIFELRFTNLGIEHAASPRGGGEYKGENETVSA